MSFQSMSFLRRVLLVDAVSSGVMGLVALAFADVMADLLSLPATLLTEVGIVLLPFAAFVGYLAMSRNPPRAGVWAVIVINVLWTMDSFALLFTDWVDPNAWGSAFIVGQALAVALFADLEYIGLRKSAIAA